MLKTTLIDGIPAAKFDKQITTNLLLEHVAADVVRKEKLLIGVRNEEGEIFRLIGATKPNSYMNAVEELEDLGLVDELKGMDNTDGYDAIFSEE